jgi:transposase, IS30 family
MKSYMHLKTHERDRIAIWRSRGLSLREIAKKVGRHYSTLCRELNRNCGRKGYWPHRAHERALWRRQNTHKRIRLKSRVLRFEVEQMLTKGWSPELIAGRLRRKRSELPSITHEAIYQWIYAERPDLVHYLTRAHPKRKRRWRLSSRKTRIPDRVSIRQRPERINQRKEPGHWETDLVVGSGKSALQVSVERVSRCTRMRKIPNKSAPESRLALEAIFKPLPPALRRSITYDNGPENTEHQILNQTLGTRSWFCEPYHSWEKAQVENTNGLIRRHIPKRANFDELPESEIQKVEVWLNERPRKVLQFQTPSEVFNALCCT